MSLDLNKLANKLDEALSNETTETLTKFLNDKTMSNNKQSSVSSLIAEIQRRVAIIQSEPQTMARELMIDNLSVDLEQYEAMHKEEIKQAIMFGDCRGQISTYATSEQYYNETFGGNNEQKAISETASTNTAKGYWVKDLKIKVGNNEQHS
jgi:hypothetical protein